MSNFSPTQMQQMAQAITDALAVATVDVAMPTPATIASALSKKIDIGAEVANAMAPIVQQLQAAQFTPQQLANAVATVLGPALGTLNTSVRALPSAADISTAVQQGLTPAMSQITQSLTALAQNVQAMGQAAEQQPTRKESGGLTAKDLAEILAAQKPQQPGMMGGTMSPEMQALLQWKAMENGMMPSPFGGGYVHPPGHNQGPKPMDVQTLLPMVAQGLNIASSWKNLNQPVALPTFAGPNGGFN